MFTWLLVILALPPLAAAAYLATLAIFSRRAAAPLASTAIRFDVIVPAHDEAPVIARAVRSLLAMDYPADRYRVLVVADNCTDDTADRAAAAGAHVLVRTDREARGKGHALAYGYAQSLADGVADAVVVVDADSDVTPNLLRAFAARFAAGAEALQAEYAVRNPDASWRTRLMTVAFTLFHTLRSLGRERMRLSCGLRGNGMAFTADLLRRVPPAAFSIVEDVEYGVQLGLAGVRIEYVAEAEVRGDMPESAEASRSQRERWEKGRWSLARQHVPTLLRAARHDPRRGRVPLDLAMDLLVPPLVPLVAATMLGVVVASWAYTMHRAGSGALLAWGAAAAGLAVYAIRGLVLTRIGPRVLADLVWVPAYAGWKLALAVRRTPAPVEWIRTGRGRDPATTALQPVSQRTMISDINDVLEGLSDSTGWPSIWFTIADHQWDTLVVVPADRDLVVHPVARALTEAARLYEERPIRFVNAEDVNPRETREIIAQLRSDAAQGHRTIVAIRSPLVSHPATPIARACDAAVLLIPMGTARLGPARETISAVGHRAFLGAFTISSHGNVPTAPVTDDAAIGG